MQFNDVSLEQGICQEIDSLCDTDSTSYTLATKTRRCNTALLDLELKALMASGRWQFDDTNYTSLPTGLISAVDGTLEYAFDATLLRIEKMYILLKDGVTWQELFPMDEKTSPYTPTDYAVQATPTRYYKRGKFFGFDSTPKSTNMTLTNGIKVIFSRTGSLFAATDTTKEPGFPSPFHILIAQKASLPYCKTYKKDRVPQLAADIADGEKQMKAYFASRAQDEGSGRMTMKKVSGR